MTTNTKSPNNEHKDDEDIIVLCNNALKYPSCHFCKHSKPHKISYDTGIPCTSEEVCMVSVSVNFKEFKDVNSFCEIIIDKNTGDIEDD